MRLSTSNSKFLFKAIGVALFLVVGYIAAIQIVKPKIVFFQNQYQSNFIFAQDFIYLEPKPSSVIVGSSMATRMKFQKDDGVYNLAFGGGGPLTGLEIIRQSGYLPETIYIESNVFSMGVDENFLDHLFPYILTNLRGKVVAFQEKYQVLNIVGSMIYHFAGRSMEEKLHQKVDEKLLDKLVAKSLEKANTFEFKNRHNVLKRWHVNIDFFVQQGTTLIFFEMPNDTRLLKTKKQMSLRKLIKGEFPSILYVEENNENDIYKTADGVHLTPQSAIDFSDKFKSCILPKSLKL